MIRSARIDSGDHKFSGLESVIVLLLYFLGQNAVIIVSEWITVNILGYSGGIHEYVALGGLILLFAIIIFVVRKPLIGSLKSFFSKDKWLTNLKKVLKIWGVMLVATVAIAAFIQLFVPDNMQAGNQVEVVNTFKKAPTYMFFNIIVFAPVVEEIIFRGVLYQTMRSHKVYGLAIFISAFIFGGLHVFPAFTQTGNLQELLFLIQYCGMAVFIIMAMEATDSIWGGIFIHLLNNALSLITIIASLGVIV